MQRRPVLKYLAISSAVLCPACLAALAARATESSGHGGAAPHWTYEGETGPAHWGQLAPDFRVCEIGTQQSPIDLSGSVAAEIGPLDIAYQRMPLQLVNTGHTIQVTCEPGSGITVDRQAYRLIQFHFHHPSEHQVDGVPHKMEVHFVHSSEAAGLAVLGVFLRPGAENAVLEPIWQAMPTEAGQESAPSAVSIDPAGLLPQDRGYYRYQGSLTTPPCSETVLWTVFRQPLEVSDGQIERFARLFPPMNARPVTPLSRRFLLQSQ